MKQKKHLRFIATACCLGILLSLCLAGCTPGGQQAQNPDGSAEADPSVTESTPPAGPSSPVSSDPNGADTIIRAYISYLGDPAASGGEPDFLLETPGMGTTAIPDVTTLEDAEAAGLLSPEHTTDAAARAEYCFAVAVQQHDLVIAQFGPDAWDHVTYTLKEIEPVTSSSKAYNVLLAFNGKAVSEEGYQDFLFVIDAPDGVWRVFQGLSWAEPYPEYPTGD